MVNVEVREQLHSKFAEFIRSKKMRQTPERFAILDKALDQHAHFDIDELYHDIENEYRVCRATVYNTVELLCECNILRKHFIQENKAAYEMADDHHLHLICLKCGEMTEIRDEKVDRTTEDMKFPGFRPVCVVTNIYGLCSKCERKERQRKTKKPKI